MSTSLSRKNVSFSKHLKKISPLLSIFGVLNALIIYSTDKMGDTIIGVSLNISLFLLSLLILAHIIKETIMVEQASTSFVIFYGLIVLITFLWTGTFLLKYGRFVVVGVVFLIVASLPFIVTGFFAGKEKVVDFLRTKLYKSRPVHYWILLSYFVYFSITLYSTYKIYDQINK